MASIRKVAHGSNDQFKSPPSLLVYFTLVITSSTAFGVLTAATLSSPDVDRVPETGSLLLLKASLASTASVLEEDVVVVSANIPTGIANIEETRMNRLARCIHLAGHFFVSFNRFIKFPFPLEIIPKKTMDRIPNKLKNISIYTLLSTSIIVHLK